MLALAQRRAEQFVVLEHEAGDRHLHGGLEPQHLFERTRLERGIALQPCELFTIAQEPGNAHADVVLGVLDACTDEHAHRGRELEAVQRVAVALCLDECRQQVVARLGAPLLDQRVDVRTKRSGTTIGVREVESLTVGCTATTEHVGPLDQIAIAGHPHAEHLADHHDRDVVGEPRITSPPPFASGTSSNESTWP